MVRIQVNTYICRYKVDIVLTNVHNNTFIRSHDYSGILGGVTRNATGHVVGARVAQVL